MDSLPVLDATDQRILGSLLEKQVTVPGSYPLSLNALRTACNQSNSRDPVMNLDEPAVQAAVKSLRDRGLVRFVWAGKGSRVVKYHQLLQETLELADDERALLTVLLLRGPQSCGELRARTERLHSFADKTEVAATLGRLAARPVPLVRDLGVRRGQQEARWVHLLGPVSSPAVADAAGSGPDRESVLAAGAAARDAAVIAAWDAVADEWADAHADDLPQQPLDLWLLERVAGLAGDDPILDLACGPGQVTAFLADTGAQVSGLDCSPAMIARARADYPDLDFSVGDLRSLLRPRRAPAWGAVVALQCWQHLAPSELAPAVAEMARVLRPGGHLLLSAMVGERVRTLTEFLGHPVEVGVIDHAPADLLAAVTSAGLVDVEWYHRGPLAHEGSAEHLHVLARKP